MKSDSVAGSTAGIVTPLEEIHAAADDRTCALPLTHAMQIIESVSQSDGGDRKRFSDSSEIMLSTLTLLERNCYDSFLFTCSEVCGSMDHSPNATIGR